MTKAEEKSIAYQLVTHGPRVMGGDAILSEEDYKFWNINYDFKAGYEEAEKDLALAWEDIRTITKILEDIVQEDILVEFYNGDAISCYKEVLRRFKEAKK